MKTTDIKTKIAEKISSASEEVSNSVINEFASIEIKRRTDLVSESVRLVQRMERKLELLEVCDLVTYNKEGEKKEEYSENRFNSIKELKEKIAKLYDASDNALKDNNEEVFAVLDTTIITFKQTCLNY
jgi:hypothetical protein